MAVNQVNLFDPESRQQLMAAQLAGTPAIDTSRWQGRQTPAYGVGHGLVDAGQKLAAAWMARKSDKRVAADDEKRRQEQARILSEMGGNRQEDQPDFVGPPSPINPYDVSQRGLEAGIDPNLVQAYMQQKMPAETGAGSASTQGYELAKSQGYEGSYLDYKREFEGREANLPSSVLEWQVFNGLSSDEQQRYLEMKRSVPIENINSVPSRVLPGGGVQPLSSLDSESDAKQAIAEATAQGAANVIPAERRLDAQAKEPRVAAAQRRLDRVTAASEALGSGGGPLEGGARTLVGTPAAQEMEAANALLINELTALTRIPGVGSQSDLEQRLAQLALPSASQHEAVRARSIEELNAFIADLDAALQKISGTQSTALPEIVPPNGMPDFTNMSDEDLLRLAGGR